MNLLYLAQARHEWLKRLLVQVKPTGTQHPVAVGVEEEL
jgi:hypothetical protein